MYADKRWLSLIITLCLASMNQSQEEDNKHGVSESDSNAGNPTTENADQECAAYEDNKPITEHQLNQLISECDQNNKLFVIYIVKNNTNFDSVFSDLKQSNPYVMFVKIDISIFKCSQFDIQGNFEQPIIVFHRFKEWKNQFAYPGKEELDKKVKAHNEMTEEQFIKENDVVTPIIMNQGTSGGIIKTYKSSEEFNELSLFDHTKVFVIFMVKHTKEYDAIFTNLANNFTELWVFRMDIDDFYFKDPKDKKMGTPILQPMVSINKFGNVLKRYFSVDTTFLEKELQEIIDFKGCVEFETQEIETENQLDKLLSKCDIYDQLSVIYIVHNNVTLDSIFSDLKISYPYTMFVKIEKSTFDSNNKMFDIDESKGESKILLHRFGDWRNELMYSNEEELKKIISIHSKLQGCGTYDKKQIMTEDLLNNLLTECDISKQLSVIYIVNNNNEFDWIFSTFEYTYLYIMFVKIDKSTFESNNEMFDIDESIKKPKIIFHRFGHWKNEGIYFEDEDKLDRKITLLTEMTKEQFTKVGKDVPNAGKDDSKSDHDENKQEAQGDTPESVHDEKKADADVPNTEGGNTNVEN